MMMYPQIRILLNLISACGVVRQRAFASPGATQKPLFQTKPQNFMPI
jgi:hypothetical protein